MCFKERSPWNEKQIQVSSKYFLVFSVTKGRRLGIIITSQCSGLRAFSLILKVHHAFLIEKLYSYLAKYLQNFLTTESFKGIFLLFLFKTGFQCKQMKKKIMDFTYIVSQPYREVINYFNLHGPIFLLYRLKQYVMCFPSLRGSFIKFSNFSINQDKNLRYPKSPKHENLIQIYLVFHNCQIHIKYLSLLNYNWHILFIMYLLIHTNETDRPVCTHWSSSILRI